MIIIANTFSERNSNLSVTKFVNIEEHSKILIMEEKLKLNQFLIDQARLLSDATEVLNGLVKCVGGLFDDLSVYFTKRNEIEEKNFLELESESEKIMNYINQVHAEIPALTKVINDSEIELQEYQRKLMEIQERSKELEEQSNHQKKIAEEATKQYEDTMEELNVQSSYSAAMGSVLGTMLWKTSKTEQVIETYIETGTLNQFLNLVDNTLKSFKKTYTHELPMAETHEFKYLISLFGISINIVAQRIGRDYVLQRENGLSFIRRAIEYLGEIPMPKGNLLKRLILMLTYNLSITKRGAKFIQITDLAVENILKCYNENHSTDVQSLAITLMTSLLVELPTHEFCEKVMDKVRFLFFNFIMTKLH